MLHYDTLKLDETDLPIIENLLKDYPLLKEVILLRYYHKLTKEATAEKLKYSVRHIERIESRARFTLIRLALENLKQRTD